MLPPEGCSHDVAEEINRLADDDWQKGLEIAKMIRARECDMTIVAALETWRARHALMLVAERQSVLWLKAAADLFVEKQLWNHEVPAIFYMPTYNGMLHMAMMFGQAASGLASLRPSLWPVMAETGQHMPFALVEEMGGVPSLLEASTTALTAKAFRVMNEKWYPFNSKEVMQSAIVDDGCRDFLEDLEDMLEENYFEYDEEDEVMLKESAVFDETPTVASLK